MSTPKSFIAFLCIVGCALWSQSTLPDCPCKSNADEPVYRSMPSDTSFPEPSVVETSQKGKAETVRIRYFLRASARSDREVFMQTSDGGLSWSSPHEGKRLKNYEKRFGLLVYQYGTNTVFQRSKDGGEHLERPLFRVAGKNGQVLNLLEQTGIRFIFSAIHPQQPTTIYGCFEPVREHDDGNLPLSPGLYVSVDAGDNWALLTEQVRGRRLNEGCPLGISPSNPEIMIGHGLNSVIISRDGGTNWEAVGGGVDLEKPAILKGYQENLEALRKKGVSPAKQWPFDWTYLLVTQISFLPHDQNVAFLVTNKGIYKTEDGTHTWCLLDTGPPKLFHIHDIFIDPLHRNRIFVGTNSRILTSDDLGCRFKTFFDSEVSGNHN